MKSITKPLSPNDVVAQISGAKESLIQSSISENTRRAYQRAWTRWVDYRQQTKSEENDNGLASFITYLHEIEYLSKSTIALILSGVRFGYKIQEREIYGTESQMVMRGIQRTGRKGRGQSTGINVDIVKSARSRLFKSGSVKDLRDGLLIGLLSDGLLRRSELLSIRVGDIEQSSDKSGRLTIHRSKTDQEGKGAVVFLSPDTMVIYTAFIRLTGLGQDDILIQSMTKHGKLRGHKMSPVGLNKLIKSLWEKLFGDCAGVSSHSFRIGTAQSLSERGAGLVELQNAGRWSSPSMPAKYTRNQEAGRGAVARLLYGNCAKQSTSSETDKSL